jgi:hypothetical protein
MWFSRSRLHLLIWIAWVVTLLPMLSIAESIPSQVATGPGWVTYGVGPFKYLTKSAWWQPTPAPFGGLPGSTSRVVTKTEWHSSGLYWVACGVPLATGIALSLALLLYYSIPKAHRKMRFWITPLLAACALGFFLVLQSRVEPSPGFQPIGCRPGCFPLDAFVVDGFVIAGQHQSWPNGTLWSLP